MRLRRVVAVTVLWIGATGAPISAQSAEGWRIRLQGTAPGVTDKAGLTLGATTTADSGLDPLDDPHPPTLPSRYLDLVTRHAQADPGWGGQALPSTRYRAEYGPPLGSSARTFDLSLETDLAGPVTLTWAISPDLDLAAHFLTLRDVATGTSLDMWAVTTHTVAVAPGPRVLRIEIRPGRVASPVAFDQAVTLAEDASLPITLSAADAQSRPLTYRTLGPPAHGTLLGSEPTVTYFPAANYNGPDSFTFVANNGSADSNVATVDISVTPANDSPVALGQSVSTDEDTSVAIHLVGLDVDGDALAYAVLSNPRQGTLSGTGPDVVYAPAADFSGPDAFAFTVSDGTMTSDPAVITIAVAPTPDPPRAAFTVPGPARDAATLDSNRASHFEGARVVDASSESPGFPASYAIDESAQTLWRSASGQPTNQSLTVALPEASSVNRIRVVNGYGAGGQAVKRFEVKVSTTTTEPTAFTTVLSDVALDAATVQEFALPATTPARYVQLFALDNWGNPCCVAVREFEAVSDALGGIPTYANTPSNVALASEGASAAATSEFSGGFGAAFAIDGQPGTRWASGNGHPANESLTVTLARGKSYKVDRVRVWNAFGAASQEVRDFRIAVSSTTNDPGAFATAFNGTLQDVAGAQEFVFPGGPVDARYLRFTALNNYGSPCCSSIVDLEALPLPSKPPSASSYLSPDYRPELVLDGKPGTAWQTAPGSVANQFLEVRLEDEVLVDRVRVLGWPSAGDWVIKDFDVLVSTTTDDDAAFTPVLSATNRNNGASQEFVFPGGARRARYVRLVARNNYGNATGLTVSSFEVLTVASEGNRISANATVVGSSSQFGSFGPQAALDADPSPPGWVTAPGQATNQWMKIALPSARSWLIDHVALQPRSEPGTEPASPRQFEIQTSTTTSDDTAFATVFKGALRNNGAPQHFFFGGVNAKYVRVLLEDNYGGGTTGLQTFAVYSPQIGSMEARFRDRSDDPDGAIGTYAWAFGDGGSSSERDAAHAYAAAGHYEVTLAATDETSLTGSVTQFYEAIGGPLASFTASPAAPGEGAMVTFTDTSVDPAGVVLREWDFGDGKPRVVTASSSATHAYDDDGAYPVTLRVTNAWGTTASSSQSLIAANLPPTANAGADAKVRLGQDWGVFPSVSDPGPGDLATLQCHWSFGDGEAIDIQNCGQAGARVSHVYAAQGVYTATLTVIDKNGASSADSVTVGVYPPECVLGSGTFVEFPFCGSGYSIENLGGVAGLPTTTYGGLVVDSGDPARLLLATSATASDGAIYSVELVRDASHHIAAFSGTPSHVASVPDIDGGLAYGPDGVLFTAQWPTQNLVQIKPGSQVPDKVTPNASIGVDSISLNFVPSGFPGACALKCVSFFTAQWWSSTLSPNAGGTFDVSPAYEAAGIYKGGPEHLLYVPAGSAIFADRNTVLVTEYTAGNIVAYNLDANGDPIPSTRTVFLSGYPSPEAMAIDPVTGDLLISNLQGVTVNRVAGLRPPASQIALTPASAVAPAGQPHTITATVTEPLGTARPGVSVVFAVTAGPNTGAAGTCAPNADCTTDANGVVRFTYTGGSAEETDSVQASFTGASCGTISSQLASVTWGSNRPPVAQSGTSATDEDAPVTLAMLAADPDGDALAYEITSAPQHGALSGTAPSLTYTPAPDYNGSDAFRFVVSDGEVQSSEAIVDITVRPVNDAPVVSPISASGAEDGPIAIHLAASDVDGDALSYLVVSPPNHGTLTGTGADLSYAPAANYSGIDSFAYKASDGYTYSSLGDVAVTVAAVNDPPVASNQFLTTTRGTAVSVALAAVDVDEDALTYSVVAQPAHGTLSGSPPSLTYTPAGSYTGADSLTFKARDALMYSNVATVAITVTAPVNHPPSCSGAQATPTSLWPPNHKMRSIAVQGVSDSDGDAVTIRATSIFQDERTNGCGDGDTAIDAIKQPLQVRAERSGEGDGRVYHINFTATDSQGATCSGSVQLCVPHDQGGGSQCVDGGSLYDSTR